MIYNLKQFLMILLSLLLFSFQSIYSLKVAEECYDICNSFKRQVLTLEMCREAKKLLPRPKIGDFCTRAMEDGFKDACYSLCQGQEPVPRIAQACRVAAMELPRPTVRKWCEHGYRQGYKATVDSLTSYFSNPVEEESEYSHSQIETNVNNNNNENNNNNNQIEENIHESENVKIEQTKVTTESSVIVDEYQSNEINQENIQTTTTTTSIEVGNNENNNLTLKKSIPITLDDNTHHLNLYEEQSPEDSVALFCSKYMSEEISGCIRQLLPLALED